MMKQVHAAKQAAEAYFIKGLLESNGIAATVRGEYLTSGWGELPVDMCSVWIVDGTLHERANALIVAYLKGDHARQFCGQHWFCSHCGEQLEGQFTACWRCGARRP